MSKKLNKQQLKEQRKIEQSKGKHKAKKASTSKKSSKKQRKYVPYTVNLMLLPNSQTVLVSSNFNSLALVRGMVDEAHDNLVHNNNERFLNISKQHIDYLRHQRKVAQNRKAAAWSKHEKERLHRDAHKHDDKRK